MKSMPTRRISSKLHDKPIITATARKYGALLRRPVTQPMRMKMEELRR